MTLLYINRWYMKKSTEKLSNTLHPWTNMLAESLELLPEPSKFTTLILATCNFHHFQKALAHYTQNCKDFSKNVVMKIVAHI